MLDFPYVNGGLFARPQTPAAFDREMRDRLYKMDMDWRHISPAIFGSLFLCIMDPKLRRSLGAHYTSEENILKLINPLFMDDLRDELKKAGHNKDRLNKLWNKIENIRVFDPACGCGNFLIIAYRELRHLEMDIMDAYGKGQTFIQVTRLSVDHFYGIEIEKFPSLIANTAILLMEHLLNLESRSRFGLERHHPAEGEGEHHTGRFARHRLDHAGGPKDIDVHHRESAVRGCEASGRETEEADDGVLREERRNRGLRLRLVCESVQDDVAEPQDKDGVRVNQLHHSVGAGRAYLEAHHGFWVQDQLRFRTFKWMNEAKGVAEVHVVIIGFSHLDVSCKIYIHTEGVTGEVIAVPAKHINAYLVDGPDVYLPNRSKPICDVPEIGMGNKPIDNGNYLFTRNEMLDFVAKEPKSKQYFRRWYAAQEFIHKEEKYCLWLGECEPSELRSMPECMK